MGQGTHTKIAQVVANSLGLPYEKVKISSTNTTKVPNTSASAASSTTDLNAAAALNATNKIKKNLEKFIKDKYKIFSKEEPVYKNESIIFGNRSFEFKKIVMEAYLNRVSLSSSGFYSTPKINFDKKKDLFELSIKELEIQEEKQALEQYGSSSSGASLGDILGAELEDKVKGMKKDSAKVKNEGKEWFSSRFFFKKKIKHTSKPLFIVNWMKI